MFTPIEIVLAVIVACGLGYAGVKWLYKKDTEIENRRREAVKIAGTLESLGLPRLADFFADYSVGDYSGMAEHIKNLAVALASGEKAIVQEFELIFSRCLAAKLENEEGRAFIAARLADAVTESDTTTAKEAPKASVSVG
jgi:hypothetical protein